MNNNLGLSEAYSHNTLNYRPRDLDSLVINWRTMRNIWQWENEIRDCASQEVCWRESLGFGKDIMWPDFAWLCCWSPALSRSRQLLPYCIESHRIPLGGFLVAGPMEKDARSRVERGESGVARRKSGEGRASRARVARGGTEVWWLCRRMMWFCSERFAEDLAEFHVFNVIYSVTAHDGVTNHDNRPPFI